ncbi:MAG: RNA polymerase sigma factor [Rhodospirillales bacterium]
MGPGEPSHRTGPPAGGRRAAGFPEGPRVIFCPEHAEAFSQGRDAKSRPDMDARSDEELMAAVGRGDQRAFAGLVERHSRRAAVLAARITLNRSDAEEVVQEAFMRVWVKAPAWRSQAEGGGAQFGTWFHRVVVNLSIDRRRKPAGEELEKAGEIADDAPSALDAVEGGETGERVAEAVARLPSRQRAALTLCHYEGMSNIEAAAALGITVGAVESLLVRARRALKEDLADLAPEGAAAKSGGPQ